MPELPEVETVRRALAPAMEGARLSKLVCHRPNLRYAFPEAMAERLEGQEILRLDRRAKYLLAYLSSQEVWVTHLGMTGRFSLEDQQTSAYVYDQAAKPAHLHLSVELLRPERDLKPLRLDYYDPRRFGFMLLYSYGALLEAPWYRALGHEPLGSEFTPEVLGLGLERSKGPIKPRLLSQDLVVGLGNIYICEALYRAKIHPSSLCQRVPKSKVGSLFEAIRAVLNEAIAKGGSSISDFSSTQGELGYFQHSFQVYDRQGLACLRAGCGGEIGRLVQAGRSSFYCQTCQSLYE